MSALCLLIDALRRLAGALYSPTGALRWLIDALRRLTQSTYKIIQGICLEIFFILFAEFSFPFSLFSEISSLVVGRNLLIALLYP